MNRTTTNAIRWVMDELVPAVIRDSRLFMWSFFCIAYRTYNPKRYMQFKSRVWQMSPRAYAEFYNQLNSISRNRPTDNSEKCINQIKADCKDSASVLDVGCGHGYLLRKLRAAYPHCQLLGADLLTNVPSIDFEYVTAMADNLPFPDNEFEVVCCTHVIEHVKQPELVIRELMRIAKRKVIVVTPKQRPYYYTLDEHINFFFYREQLEALVPTGAIHTQNLSGDWYMVISK
jgi:ubiquinone/menaquinone biosynthesis C-methylase UbiE